MTSKISNFINNPIHREFLTSINKVFLFKVLVYFITTIILVLTARNLTPAQFGRTGVINSLAYLLFVPMILGVHSSMYKYLPTSSEKDRNELIIISAVGSIISIFGFSSIMLYANRFIINWLNIPIKEWHLVILLTIFVSLSTISESFLRGQERFNAICIFKLISAVANIILIIIYYFIFNIKNLDAYIFSLIISHIVFTLLALTKTGVKKIPRISWSSVKKVYVYSSSNILSMLLGGITLTSDLFIVNYFCSSSTVGTYNAYQGFMKNIFSVLFYEIFLVVFLPFLAKANSKMLEKKIRKYTPVIIIAVFLVSGIITSIFICLFGQNYKLNFIYIAISSLGIALYSIYQVYVYLYNMEGSRRAMVTGLSTLIVLPVTLGLQYYLIRNYNMTGALVSVVLTNFILIISLKITKNVHRKTLVSN